MKPEKPWISQYDGVPESLSYPDSSMTALVFGAAKQYPAYTAYSYMGKKTSYREAEKKIRLCARAFAAMGIRKGDRVTLCLPNTPQAVICFYALNLIGAVSNMIHPLSSENEIRFFLQESDSAAAVTLDSFAGHFTGKGLKFTVVTGAADELSLPARLLLSKSFPKDPGFLSWREFLKKGKTFDGAYEAEGKGDGVSSILYSGGTTGKTKGVLLTNLNFNSAALQTGAMSHCLVPGGKMLAVLPIFHGFGLGVCIHLMLTGGGEAILVPRFNAKSFSKLIRKTKPEYICGVPTLFEAMLRSPDMKNADLSGLKGVFSGGDALPLTLKETFDRFLRAHNASVQIREGFGMAECVTASCLTPYNKYKPGSIGLPFPDMLYKIVKPETDELLPYGETGEICIHGPSVMKGYLKNPEETEKTLRLHRDGLVWLHTGDLGKMDEEGFVYFIQRIKRMIVTSGYSVYPSQLEEVIRGFAPVRDCCVVGVPDSYRGQRIRACVILKDPAQEPERAREELLACCRENIARYAMPREIVFMKDFPRTKVGKIAYTELENRKGESI